jgi:RHH-type proline utilization regulon transcriptional repressor/proline dehydrogenase/delta 1-pyrroline-5-carboxylate dehydrogenase
MKPACRRRRCIWWPGDGRIGGVLVAHPDIAGVVFTGSTEVARTINRALAAKDGPIVPLIAETGGINAMIVDATALPEQVADDVVTSAFRSAGQRCSALRLLFLQDDVADRMIEMIAGAARELVIGDPADPATHIGPVIDAEARQRLDAHIERMKKEARVHFAGSAPQAITSRRIFSNCPMPAGSRKKCSARCCMWCATAPTGSIRCCKRSSAPATG